MSYARPVVPAPRVFRVVVIIAAAAAMVSCSGGAASEAPPGATPAGPGGGGRGAGAAVVVTTAPVVEKPMPVQVRAVGNVEASSSVAIRSQVSGELMNVGFKEGEDVRAGQVLFMLDSRQYEVALKQAQAALARSTAEAKGMRAQVTRAEELYKQGLLPRSEREALLTDMAVADAAIAANNAQIEDAELQLQYTRITAPVSGRTGALLVHQGALVRANDTTPLVVINQIAPAFVTFAVPARLLPQLSGDRAQAVLKVQAAPAGSSEPPAAGTVSFVDNAVDQATDTIRLKATFPNRDRRLWAGAFVDVTLQLAQMPRAVVVPNASVQASQQGQYVYVLKADSTVEMRPVKVAWINQGDTVIESGVRAGETVVTDGQLRLTPGARVSVKSADPQPRTTS
jgi:multidrug efflux system membrane fusion protein